MVVLAVDNGWVQGSELVTDSPACVSELKVAVGWLQAVTVGMAASFGVPIEEPHAAHAPEALDDLVDATAVEELQSDQEVSGYVGSTTTFDVAKERNSDHCSVVVTLE